ncbi:MAG: hypothetical protein RIS54_394 [Verrucomicrobiota bacterium]|jgi:hypothetical protein
MNFSNAFRTVLAVGLAALGVLLTAAQRWPEQRGLLVDEVTALRAQLPIESLLPPVAELLAAWDAA